MIKTASRSFLGSTRRINPRVAVPFPPLSPPVDDILIENPLTVQDDVVLVSSDSICHTSLEEPQQTDDHKGPFQPLTQVLPDIVVIPPEEEGISNSTFFVFDASEPRSPQTPDMDRLDEALAVLERMTESTPAFRRPERGSLEDVVVLPKKKSSLDVDRSSPSMQTLPPAPMEKTGTRHRVGKALKGILKAAKQPNVTAQIPTLSYQPVLDVSRASKDISYSDSGDKNKAQDDTPGSPRTEAWNILAGATPELGSSKTSFTPGTPGTHSIRRASKLPSFSKFFNSKSRPLPKMSSPPPLPARQSFTPPAPRSHKNDPYSHSRIPRSSSQSLPLKKSRKKKALSDHESMIGSGFKRQSYTDDKALPPLPLRTSDSVPRTMGIVASAIMHRPVNSGSSTSSTSPRPVPAIPTLWTAQTPPYRFKEDLQAETTASATMRRGKGIHTVTRPFSSFFTSSSSAAMPSHVSPPPCKTSPRSFLARFSLQASPPPQSSAPLGHPLARVFANEPEAGVVAKLNSLHFSELSFDVSAF